MNYRKRFLSLFLLMVSSVLITVCSTVYLLYNVTLNQQKQRLQESAQSRARIVEALVDYHIGELRTKSGDLFDIQESLSLTLQQLLTAHQRFRGFGETGEFTLARLDEDQMIFLMRHRHSNVAWPKPLPLQSPLAEPMSLALSGVSGTIIGQDYRGETVVAAHEPVLFFSSDARDIERWGIVAKIDLAEIREPFQRAVYISVVCALVLICGSVFIFVKISDPILKVLSERNENLEKLVEVRTHEMQQANEELHREIQQRQRVAEELQLQSRVLESVAEGVSVSDTAGNIVFTNAAFQNMFRYDRHELIGRNITSLMAFSTEENEEILKGIMSSFLVSGKWKGELEQRRKDGTEFTSLTHMSNLNTADHTYWISVQMDISERKALENRLAQSQKMEAIGTLAGGIAHDFNNVLAVVKGYTELLQVEIGDKKYQRYLGNIHKSTLRAIDLVEQILIYSRADKQEVHPTLIAPIVKEAMKLVRRTIPATVKIDDQIEDCPAILCNATQIHQIIVNLCTNAYHAMMDTGGNLQVSLMDMQMDSEHAGQLGLQGTYVHLCVEDSGTGIPRNILDKIFDPYFTTKEVGKGTGLGLSVVQGIVETYNGVINVDTELGHGTRFDIYLPTVESAPIEENEVLNPREGSARILVIDDEEELLTLYNISLKKLSYRVTAFTDSWNAMEAFSRDPHGFDIIFTDQNMPKLSGLQLCARVREIRKDIPIIMASGYSEMTTPERLKDVGIGRLFSKPVNIAELTHTIQQLVEGEPINVSEVDS